MRHFRLRRIFCSLIFLSSICLFVFLFNNLRNYVKIVTYEVNVENLSESRSLPKKSAEKSDLMHAVPLVGLPDSAINNGSSITSSAFIADISELVDRKSDAPILPGTDRKDSLSVQLTPSRRANRGEMLTVEEVRGGMPLNPVMKKRRDFVRNMTKHAWMSYKLYAWGHNELKPNLKTFHNVDVLGRAPMGATILDAIDSLYIMGLKSEYDDAKNWIKHNLTFNLNTHVSLFEFTIRSIGGLLSIFSLTRNSLFLSKAVEAINHVLPAFNSPTGLPFAFVNLVTKKSYNYRWTPSACSILSEVGTLHMEFQYMSELTGDKSYGQLVHRIRDHLQNKSRYNNNLFNTYVNPSTGEFCSREVSMAALGDSFYEYLLKEWIRTGKEDTTSRAMFDSAIEGIRRIGMLRRSPSGSLYLANFDGGRLTNSMEHLACYAGGNFALSAPNSSVDMFSIGEELTATCRKSYASTDTHLGPEKFDFTNSVDAVASSHSDRKFLLRPETVESYFYLWRLTKQEQYRDMAWDFAMALEKYCRSDSGYSGILDVYSVNSPKDNVQQSYFLAETLKYLYLIFSEDTLLPLERWVFNTEAHPFPIRGKVDLGADIWPK